MTRVQWRPRRVAFTPSRVSSIQPALHLPIDSYAGNIAPELLLLSDLRLPRIVACVRGPRQKLGACIAPRRSCLHACCRCVLHASSPCRNRRGQLTGRQQSGTSDQRRGVEGAGARGGKEQTYLDFGQKSFGRSVSKVSIGCSWLRLHANARAYVTLLSSALRRTEAAQQKKSPPAIELLSTLSALTPTRK